MTGSGGVVIHAGPSLPSRWRQAWPEWSWRSPAVAGDALRAAETGASVFVLIDGLFDAECAIRHNELLKLLAAGVHVLGAASMGALRAAELHGYGMVGVGRAFEAFRDRRWLGDDEVALLHGPAQLDWLALTVPLANIRATLVKARRSGRLGASIAREILGRAQALCFSDRTWANLMEDRGDEAQASLCAWLESNTVDLKRRDALDALKQIAVLQTQPAPRADPPPHTLFSEALARSVKIGG